MKRMCTYIVLCGMLSSSLVMFGMEQQKLQQLTNSGNNSSRSQSSFAEKFKEKAHDILEDIQAIDNVVYNTTNPIVEAVKDNPQLIVAFMEMGGVEKNNAEGIMKDYVAKDADLVDKAQDKLHAVIQGFGKSHDSDTNK